MLQRFQYHKTVSPLQYGAALIKWIQVLILEQTRDREKEEEKKLYYSLIRKLIRKVIYNKHWTKIITKVGYNWGKRRNKVEYKFFTFESNLN